MDFRFSEEQEALREIAQNFLREHSGPPQVRKAMESALGYEQETWQQIAVELGWPSVHIPEAYGGLGLGHVDLAVLLEAMGESLLCSPFFATVVLATNSILEIGTEAQKAQLLPPLAEGQHTATLALTEESGNWLAEDIETLAAPDRDGFVINGKKNWVLDGHSADLLAVVARTPGTTGEEGLSVFWLRADTPGITRIALPTMDQTRRLAQVEFSNVRVGQETLLGDLGKAWPGLCRTLDLAAIGLAAEQLGGAQSCLDKTVAYANEREQFGRPIGSFQAIKHKCADMLVAVETSRSAVCYAACIADDGSDELGVNASLAKAWCSEAYFRCAAESIQIHGGVGFTWEYDPHLHFKRARAGEHWLGDPTAHRERIAKAIGL
jgi:alkylation response protein AidB-like acyl-CoA dehydrogenase